jgi:hypothetical protein
MNLDFSFRIDQKNFEGSEKILPVLQIMDKSFLPKPNRIDITDKKSKQVSGFLDNEVIKALDIKKYAVDLCIDNINTEIMFMHGRDGFIIGFSFPEIYVNKLDFKLIIDLYLSISRIAKVTFSFCNFDDKYVEILERNRDVFNRTFYAKGLRWLNFFGPGEEERQGGKAIEQNPYATRIERFPEGLFIHVGNSPFDCLTTEGEQQLVNATKAMPPLE